MSQSPLLRLPRELRDAIYSYVCDDYQNCSYNFRDWHGIHQAEITPPFFALPTECKLSRQLYWEVTPFFLGAITPTSYDLKTTLWFDNWLSTFPSDSAYHAIQHLAFRNFNGDHQKEAFELISRCPNVKSLSVMLGEENQFQNRNHQSLAKEEPSPSKAGGKLYANIEDIILIHQLEKILEMPKLGRLFFSIHNYLALVNTSTTKELRDWFEEKFRRMGRFVEVNCLHVYDTDTDTEDMCCSIYD